MEDLWLSYTKKLQAISSTGLYYASDEYDKERYNEILKISLEMISILGNTPVSRVKDLMTKHSKGYATPKIDVRGAVFKDDKILLVKEKSDGLWTLPGGFADIGISAANNIKKEIKEEAGINVIVKKLYSVKHKALGDYKDDLRDFYKIFFICNQLDLESPKAGLEISDVDFFDIDNIPNLSRGRVIENDIEEAFKHFRNPNLETFFN